MWNEEGKSEVMQYVLENHDLDSTTAQLVRSAINYAGKLSVKVRQDFLKSFLDGIGFTDNELAAFAVGEIPRREVYPVDVVISRSYRTYVSVPPGKSKDEIKKAVIDHIVDGQDAVLTDDESLEIEADDISFVDIDFDGVQLEL